MLTEYVYVLARIAVADRQLFLQLVSATAAAQNVSEALVWEPILNQWWQRVRLLSPLLPSPPMPHPRPSSPAHPAAQFDNMSEPRHRKLTAMGIASLSFSLCSTSTA